MIVWIISNTDIFLTEFNDSQKGLVGGMCMLLSKCLNIIAGIIMYGCVFVLTVGLIFNFAMHEVIGAKLYTLEAAVI